MVLQEVLRVVLRIVPTSVANVLMVILDALHKMYNVAMPAAPNATLKPNLLLDLSIVVKRMCSKVGYVVVGII